MCLLVMAEKPFKALLVMRYSDSSMFHDLYIGGYLDCNGSLIPIETGMFNYINSRSSFSHAEKNHVACYILEFANEFDVYTCHADELEAASCYAACYAHKVMDATCYAE